jgi:adenosylhomocysteine nucleosidase
MAILFIAAEANELKSFASYLTGLRPLKWPLDYAQEGILNDRRILLAANGAGPKLAAHALEIAIRAISAADLQSSALEAVVSVGFCGALQPEIREGQIVVATGIKKGTDDIFPACPVECSQPYLSGDIVSQDRIAGKSDEKLELGRQYQALAVEMEASGVAARAKRAGLPFCCIKVVSDRADESFGLDLNEVRSVDGRISRGKIVSKAIIRPGVIPELFRLKRRADMAASVLGEFLVSCRFSVQPVGISVAENGN